MIVKCPVCAAVCEQHSGDSNSHYLVPVDTGAKLEEARILIVDILCHSTIDDDQIKKRTREFLEQLNGLGRQAQVKVESGEGQTQG